MPRQRRHLKRARRNSVAAVSVLLGVLVLIACLATATTVAAGTSSFSAVAGSPFPTGGMNPRALAFSPDGKLVAVANYTDHTVSLFAVGPGGALNLTGTPTPDDDTPESIAFSPNGSLLATANYSGNGGTGTVFVYTVGSDNSLTLDSNTPIASGTHPTSVAFSPNGQFLATANEGTNNVSVFKVPADGGATSGISEVATGPTGSMPQALAFSPSGGLLATANANSTVSVLSFNSTTGALTAVGAFPSGAQPHAIAFSPSGALLGVAGDVGVTMYTVGAGGTLATANGSPFPAGPSPDSGSFSPFGGLLAIGNDSGTNVSVFSFSSTGNLTQLPGSPLTAGDVPNAVAFSPLGGLLASANNTDNPVSVFSYPIGPPTAAISAPANGATFTVGQPATASFSCADASYGPGISSCKDSNGTLTGSGGSSTLSTSAAGTFTYTVTATSKSGQTGTASISYIVNAAPSTATSTSTPTSATTTTTPSSAGTTTTLSALKVAGAVATLTIKCAGPAGQSCDGKVALTSHVHKQGSKVTAITAVDKAKPKPKPKPRIATVKTTVGTAGFKIAVGKTSVKRVTLNATGKSLLAEFYKLSATATFSGAGLKSRTVKFAYGQIVSPITYTWHSKLGYSYESRLVIGQLPHGSVIVVACTGRACPFTLRRFVAKKPSLSLTKVLAHAHLHRGARLTLTVEAANEVGEVLRFVIQGANRKPTLADACLPPGDTKPVQCRA